MLEDDRSDAGRQAIPLASAEDRYYLTCYGCAFQWRGKWGADLLAEMWRGKIVFCPRCGQGRKQRLAI